MQVAICNFLWENAVTNTSERRREVDACISQAYDRAVTRISLVPSVLRNTVLTALTLQSFLQAWLGRFNVVDIFTLVGGNSIKGTRFYTQRGIGPAVQSITHFIVSKEEFSR